MGKYKEIKESVYKYNRDTGAIGTDHRGEYCKPLMCKKLSDEEVDVIIEHLATSDPAEVKEVIEFILDEVNDNTIDESKLKECLATTYKDVTISLMSDNF